MRSASFKHLLLAALGMVTASCGGGGGGDEQAAPNPPGNSSYAAPVATNTVAAQFEAGVYFFGGAGSSLNGVDQAYIRKVTNGEGYRHDSQTIFRAEQSRYAGADSFLSNTLFDAIAINSLGERFWVYGSGSVGKGLIYDKNNSAAIHQEGWGLELSVTSLAGTPISDYLAQARSGMNAPPVTGNFGPSASSVQLRYTSQEDRIVSFSSYINYMRDMSFNYVNNLAGLANSGTCFSNAKTGKALVIMYHDDGTADLYDTSSQSSKCSTSSVTSFGQATYVQKAFGNHHYLDFTFPSGFDASQYIPGLTAEVIAAGLHMVIAQPADDDWSVAYFMPAGFVLVDPVLHMNQGAADDLKAVLSLQ